MDNLVSWQIINGMSIRWYLAFLWKNIYDFDHRIFPLMLWYEVAGKCFIFYDLRVGNQEYKGTSTVAVDSTVTTTIEVK